ncbi:hypothetical protein E2A64_12855 [Pseudohoeflea suaedae]|uniref:Uncharacterized protein n=1 Tax=Pseudohoeflea suaedae TaxID=877384 RepID=A0A4R5PKD5_9HYPH|nr:hypothetical protein [Pseudohoeflea suaedae]TDH36170.1 hypothetical protein E2A64_12855 [Pseudohoeflea suaedae]
MQAAIIAMMILGCDDSATQCHYLDQSAKRWQTVSACDAETEERLKAYSDHRYPVIIAICQPPTDPNELIAEATGEEADGAGGVAPRVNEPKAEQDLAEDGPPANHEEARDESGITATVLRQIRSALPEKESVKDVVTAPIRFAGEGYSWVVRRFED